MKIKFWLDSGANAQSKVILTTEDLGFTDKEWTDLPEDEKEKIAKEVAFQQADWGFMEVEE